MKTLITGGSGLIGREFSSNYKMSSKDCNILNVAEIEELFEKENFDNVIHTAARVGGVLANTNYVYDFFLENIRMNTNIIGVARKRNIKKLIGFTSTCVFPADIDYPLTEEKMHYGPPHPSNYGYAHAKRMLDIQIQTCNQQYGTKYFTVIPTNVYGPNDNYHLENGHVLPSLIHRCYNAKRNGEDFEVWGSGAPLREFVFSRDVANICEILLDKYQDTTPVIISTSEEVSIKGAVDMITSILDFKGKVFWNTEKPEGQFRKPTDTTKLKSVIKNYKFTNFEKGLEETIEYFVNNYDKIRK
jgi:GDP-L-fucose synthase